MVSGGGTSPAARGTPVAPSGRPLVLAFLGVAVAFIISTVGAEYGEFEIARAAGEITSNTSPSIQQLAALRGELRRFTLLADDEVDRGSERLLGPPNPELLVARSGMDRAWVAYRALPVSPGERDLWPAAEAARVGMETAVARLDADMARGDWVGARLRLEGRVKPAADRLDATVLKLIDFNTHHGAVMASHIQNLAY